MQATLSTKIPSFLGPWLIIGLLASVILGIPWLSEFSGIRTAGLFAFALLFLCISFLNPDFSGERINYFVGRKVWVLLVLAEFVMARKTPIGEAAQGQFSHAVTGEVSLWVFLLSWVVILTCIHPTYLKDLHSSHNVILTGFVVFALLSSTYSPSPVYSLAWALKLGLVVMALGLWFSGLKTVEDIVGVFKVMWWTYLVLCLIPFVQVLSEGVYLFSGGRLSGMFSATGISRAGGTLFLLSIILFWTEKFQKMRYGIISIFGLSILLMGVGKAAILSTVIAGISFFLFMGKYWVAMIFLGSFATVALLAVFANIPMVEYLLRYQETDQLTHLTGRLGLWEASLPTIQNNLWIGKGFVASKFSSLTLDGILWEAGHLHNAFLEVLYNNGLVGLGLILMMNYTLITTFRRIIRSSKRIDLHDSISKGLVTLYLFILVNGMTFVSFGGRVHHQFMLFLIIYMLAHKMDQFMPASEPITVLKRPFRNLGIGAP